MEGVKQAHKIEESNTNRLTMNEQRINETIANIAQASEPGVLLHNANIIRANRNGLSRILHRLNSNQFLWLYRQGPKTIYGRFYPALGVQRRIEINDGSGEGEDGEAFAVIEQPQRQFGTKLVSIEKYRRKNRGRMLQEDPYNEIRVLNHIRRCCLSMPGMVQENSIRDNGIITPIGVVYDPMQEDINIGDEMQGNFFILYEYANGGDLFEAAGLDANVVRNIFRQMVRAIHYLHNQLHIFHRDLSVENFVIHNDGGGDRIYVIDFGQARIIDVREDIVFNDYVHFGKVCVCFFLLELVCFEFLNQTETV